MIRKNIPNIPDSHPNICLTESVKPPEYPLRDVGRDVGTKHPVDISVKHLIILPASTAIVRHGFCRPRIRSVGSWVYYRPQWQTADRAPWREVYRDVFFGFGRPCLRARTVRQVTSPPATVQKLRPHRP